MSNFLLILNIKLLLILINLLWINLPWFIIFNTTLITNNRGCSNLTDKAIEYLEQSFNALRILTIV